MVKPKFDFDKEWERLTKEFERDREAIRELREAQKQSEEQARRNEQIAAKSAQELRQAQAKTDEQMKLTDEQMKRTDEQIKRNEEKLTRMGILLGNVQNNIGDDTEEMFYRYLADKMELNKIKFDYLSRKTIHKSREFDIVMQNGKYSALVEVKYKAHKDDVDKLIGEQLFDFKQTVAKGKKVILALASPVLTEAVISRAKEVGVVLITQSGENVRIVDDSEAVAKEY